MKKFIYLLGAIAALTACGDDDEPYTPELNKLTNVTCTKNGVAFFQADITYDEQQRINRIVLNQEGTQSVDNYTQVSDLAFRQFVHMPVVLPASCCSR